jgi:hypothetical protein
LVATALDVALPEFPELPELPVTARGLAVAEDEALPVSPVLVALDCDVVSPVAPVRAVGLALNVAVAPSPPLASAVATE